MADSDDFVRGLTRRSFLVGSAAAGGLALLTGCSKDTGPGPDGSPNESDSGSGSDTSSSADTSGKIATGPLYIIAIDGLHPAHLDLDAKGNAGGSDGDYLMPNVRRFVDAGRFFPNAQGYLPSATDMNHLNALCGTSSAQTGVISVSVQIVGWNDDGTPKVAATHSSWARDDQGRPLTTLFHAIKAKNPQAKTAFISGKSWVGKMYDTEPKVVDFLITGDKPYEGGPRPEGDSFYDMESDVDAECDPESLTQKERLTVLLEDSPAQFPHDKFVVDSALAVLEAEKPDFVYILLAQNDDSGHALGAAWNPNEYEDRVPAYRPGPFCPDEPGYQKVSRRNAQVYREPILDSLRDIDVQFGRLLDGMESAGLFETATVFLISDHSMITHLAERAGLLGSDTDYVKLLEDKGLAQSMATLGLCSFAALYYREKKEQYAAVNPETNQSECPWWVLDREDMKNGVEGVCAKGELYHPYFVETDEERSVIWPDLVLLCKNGWQVPIYGDTFANLGMEIPGDPDSPVTLAVGGHGSVDTLPILVAVRRPGLAPGRSETQCRIADVAVTAASLYELSLGHTTVGRDLSDELA